MNDEELYIIIENNDEYLRVQTDKDTSRKIKNDEE